MNKISLNLLISGLLIAGLSSCNEKKSENTATEAASHHEDEGDWKQMDEFHTVMAEAFHPFKDSANLQPAKQYAEEMSKMAIEWEAAPLPEKVNNDEVKLILSRLKRSSSSFAETVKTGNDKAIGDSLTHLHDLFHEVQDAWYHSSGEHKQH